MENGQNLDHLKYVTIVIWPWPWNLEVDQMVKYRGRLTPLTMHENSRMLPEIA